MEPQQPLSARVTRRRVGRILRALCTLRLPHPHADAGYQYLFMQPGFMAALRVAVARNPSVPVACFVNAASTGSPDWHRQSQRIAKRAAFIEASARIAPEFGMGPRFPFYVAHPRRASWRTPEVS